ncbi:hypothetical protein [Peribacillus simplex]|nr:hypothetical protein [Peribacillus simplex]
MVGKVRGRPKNYANGRKSEGKAGIPTQRTEKVIERSEKLRERTKKYSG